MRYTYLEWKIGLSLDKLVFHLPLLTVESPIGHVVYSPPINTSISKSVHAISYIITFFRKYVKMADKVGCIFLPPCILCLFTSHFLSWLQLIPWACDFVFFSVHMIKIRTLGSGYMVSTMLSMAVSLGCISNGPDDELCLRVGTCLFCLL